jgi:hypothetical protein
MKRIFAGIVIGSLLVVPVMAESIDVVFNKVKLTVNGKDVVADNVLINGKTFVPLRAIGEMLGKDIVWKGETSTAEINDKGYNPNLIREPGYSRKNPVGGNIPVKVTFYNDAYTANVTLLEILRGEDAIEKIKKDSYVSEYSSMNYDKTLNYVVAKFKFELTKSPDKLDLSNGLFKLISADGKEYEYISATVKPSIDTKLYEGATTEGYVAFQCDLKDSAPNIVFASGYTDVPVWFKTVK